MTQMNSNCLNRRPAGPCPFHGAQSASTLWGTLSWWPTLAGIGLTGFMDFEDSSEEVRRPCGRGVPSMDSAGRGTPKSKMRRRSGETSPSTFLNHGFGEDSENVSHFHHAKWAGEHYMGGMSPELIQ
jgi:hypothetical protein